MLINKLLSFYKSEGLSDWKVYIVEPSWKYRKYDFIYFSYTGLIFGLMALTPGIKESIIPLWFFLTLTILFLIDQISSLAFDKGFISWLFRKKKEMVTAYFQELGIKTKKGDSNDWIYEYREQKLIKFFKTNKKYKAISTDYLIDELRSRQLISNGALMSVGVALILFFHDMLSDFFQYDLSLIIKLALFLILLPIFKYINSPYKTLISIIIEMHNLGSFPKQK